MRTREEIETEFTKAEITNDDRLICEVLLDIRELLMIQNETNKTK